MVLLMPPDNPARRIRKAGAVSDRATVSALPVDSRTLWLAQIRGDDTMLDRNTMFLPMLQACPGFRAEWDAFMADWADHPKGLPCYILIGDLIRYCSRRLAAGQDAEVAAAFAVAEQWLIRGDAYVREAAIVGFLEDAQNGNLHEGTEPADFERFLGSESRYWWRKVDRFWSRREPLVDDRPPPCAREAGGQE